MGLSFNREWRCVEALNPLMSQSVNDRLTILCGDALEQLRTLPEASVQTCVTSPPYWGLRDYGVEGQMGLERTPEDYVGKMVEVFREVRRVLRADGTAWVNLGDCYNAYNANRGPGAGLNKNNHNVMPSADRGLSCTSRKNKDLIGIPWRVAFALQADGWWLRCDIVWHKPNPMPESVTDRPTRAHEFVFLLSKRARYYYDAEAVKEPASESTHARISQATFYQQQGGPKDYKNGTNRSRSMRKAMENYAQNSGINPKARESAPGSKQNASFAAACSREIVAMRNKRSVWTEGRAATGAAGNPNRVEPGLREAD